MKRWSALAASALIAAMIPTAVQAGGLPGLGNFGGHARDAASKAGKKDGQPPSSAEELHLKPYTGPKKRIALADLEIKISQSTSNTATPTGTTSTTTIDLPPPTDFGSGMTEMLTTALVDTGRFVVLERKALDDILKEQALSTGAGFNPETAAKAGGLMGAQILIRGAITEYSYRKSSLGGDGILGKALGISRSSAEAMVAMDIRIYDTVTGQIIDSVRADGTAKSSGTSANIAFGDVKLGGSGFDQSPLGHATRAAIMKATKFIVDRMETRQWEARVADVDMDDMNKASVVYINAGSQCGIREGDQFDIFQSGRTIIDPETKLVLGQTRGRKLGRCRVDTVQANLATLIPVVGDVFEKGDVVRIAAGPVVAPPPTAPSAPAATTAPTTTPASTTPAASP